MRGNAPPLPSYTCDGILGPDPNGDEDGEVARLLIAGLDGGGGGAGGGGGGGDDGGGGGGGGGKYAAPVGRRGVIQGSSESPIAYCERHGLFDTAEEEAAPRRTAARPLLGITVIMACTSIFTAVVVAAILKA
jgi:hypothetical protein